MSLATVKKEYNDAILDGMARALWLQAFIDWVENSEDEEIREDIGDMRGRDWDDVAPETPHAAHLAARDLAKLWLKSEGVAHKTGLVDMFEIAMVTDKNGNFGFGESDDSELAHDFGFGIAMESLGTGVSWFDNHKQGQLNFTLPRFEVSYDGEELSWDGVEREAAGPIERRESRKGHQGAQIERDRLEFGDADAVTHQLGDITIINDPNTYSNTTAFVLGFGAYADTKLLVYASGIEHALDEAVDWIADNAPGLLADEHVNSEYDRLVVEFTDKNGDVPDEREEEKIRYRAEEDMTIAGNSGHYINSDHWHIIAEDPDRDELYELAGLNKNPKNTRTTATKPARRNPYNENLAIADYHARDYLVDNAQNGVWFGDHKVFLGSIKDVDVKDPTTRRVLLALNRDGLIRLYRADLVGAMDPKLVASSEINDGFGGTFHFIDPTYRGRGD